jgi:hypothetical protein
MENISATISSLTNVPVSNIDEDNIDEDRISQEIHKLAESIKDCLNSCQITSKMLGEIHESIRPNTAKSA